MEKMLIFGGSGSLGHELVKFYTDKYKIIVASRDEAKLWKISNKFKSLNTIICDVREESRVYEILLQEKPDIIIIAQALKQIDTCEKFPEESVKTNINGTINIINSLKILSLSNIYVPKIVCFISTDKSAGPISVYGMCKSISEKIIHNFSNHLQKYNSKAIVVRYGNVLSSKGSIVPLLLDQAKNPDICFTLTHPEMTRFMMTLSEAVSLIDMALNDGKNGELWVPKLVSMKILHLIEYFSKKYKKPYEIIGLRRVEKIHEIMLTLEEALKVDIKDKYFIFNETNEIKNNLIKEYSSAEYLLSYEELSEFMDQYLNGEFNEKC